MEHKHIQIAYQHHPSTDSLPAEEVGLLANALAATEQAHAPYSQFRVGCAVLLENGQVITGNNQENRAFPSGICAERTALFYVGAQGKASLIRKMAIRSLSERISVDYPILPCGACRQVMVEYEKQAGHPLTVLAQGASGAIIRLHGIRDTLMPFAFDTDF